MPWYSFISTSPTSNAVELLYCVLFSAAGNQCLIKMVWVIQHTVSLAITVHVIYSTLVSFRILFILIISYKELLPAFSRACNHISHFLHDNSAAANIESSHWDHECFLWTQLNSISFQKANVDPLKLLQLWCIALDSVCVICWESGDEMQESLTVLTKWPSFSGSSGGRRGDQRMQRTGVQGPVWEL